MSKCPYCLQPFTVYRRTDVRSKSGYVYDLYDKDTDSYHDIEKCKKRNGVRKTMSIIDLTIEKILPRVYYAKQTRDIWKMPFTNPPERDPNKPVYVKYLCQCDEMKCYPACYVDPRYNFKSDLEKMIFTYWCCYCGKELTNDQIKYFYTEHDFVQIMQKMRTR